MGPFVARHPHGPSGRSRPGYATIAPPLDAPMCTRHLGLHVVSPGPRSAPDLAHLSFRSQVVSHAERRGRSHRSKEARHAMRICPDVILCLCAILSGVSGNCLLFGLLRRLYAAHQRATPADRTPGEPDPRAHKPVPIEVTLYCPQAPARILPYGPAPPTSFAAPPMPWPQAPG